MEGPSSCRLPRVRFEGTFGAVARPRAWCLGVRSSGPEPGGGPDARLSLSSGPHGVNKSARRACVALTPAPWERTRRRVASAVYLRPIYSGAAQNGTMGELGAGDVRGVHIKKGQRKDRRGQRGEEGEGAHPPPLHSAPFSARIAGSESQSQAEVSLGFCWARHWVPLSSAGSMLDSIWPAGPREREEGPAQNPNCVRLSNPVLLSVKGGRIKNSCYIYRGGGWRRGNSHPCL